MRKILFLIALFIGINVYALPTTYYTNYGDYTDFQEEAITSDELTNVEVERRYIYYNEYKNYGGYFPEDMNDNLYPIIDKNDYMLSSYSPWEETKMDHIKNRIFEEKKIYEYADMKEVRYLHLYNVSGSYGAFRLSELDIRVQGSEIPYTSTCNNCNIYFYDFINNGKIDENMSVIYNGGSVTIDLGNYYKIDEIDFDLYLYDVGYDPKIYSIAFSRENNLDKLYTRAILYSYFTYDSFNDIVPFRYSVKDMAMGNPEYHDWVESPIEVDATKTRLSRTYTMYRYQDVLYHYYNLNRVYSDVYLPSPTEEYPIVTENYKDYYRKQSRNKLILEEPLVISTKEIDINSFILESSSEVFTESNVDYNKNGEYTINYIIGDLKVEKKVVVDIPENNIQEPILEEIINNDNVGTTDQVNIDNQEKQVIVDIPLEKPVEVNHAEQKPVIETIDEIPKVIETNDLDKETGETREDIKDISEELPIQKKSLVAFNVGMITIILSIIMGLWIIILTMKKNSN